MYEELIESSRACAMGYNGNCDRCLFCGMSNDKNGECYQQLHKAAADAIEELSRRCEQFQYMPPPAWIPVTERLPEAHKEVYVTDGEYIERANLLDEVFLGDQPCWSYSGLGEITHWCEKISLPEPPKEET